MTNMRSSVNMRFYPFDEQCKFRYKHDQHARRYKAFSETIRNRKTISKPLENHPNNTPDSSQHMLGSYQKHAWDQDPIFFLLFTVLWVLLWVIWLTRTMESWATSVVPWCHWGEATGGPYPSRSCMRFGFIATFVSEVRVILFFT